MLNFSFFFGCFISLCVMRLVLMFDQTARLRDLHERPFRIFGLGCAQQKGLLEMLLVIAVVAGALLCLNSHKLRA